MCKKFAQLKFGWFINTSVEGVAAVWHLPQESAPGMIPVVPLCLLRPSAILVDQYVARDPALGIVATVNVDLQIEGVRILKIHDAFGLQLGVVFRCPHRPVIVESARMAVAKKVWQKASHQRFDTINSPGRGDDPCPLTHLEEPSPPPVCHEVPWVHPLRCHPFL